MKIININESQKKRLFEAYDGKFSFDELDKQGDLSSMYNYCINHLRQTKVNLRKEVRKMRLKLEGADEVLAKIARAKEITRELNDIAYSLMPLLQIEYVPKEESEENKEKTE